MSPPKIRWDEDNAAAKDPAKAGEAREAAKAPAKSSEWRKEVERMKVGLHREFYVYRTHQASKSACFVAP